MTINDARLVEVVEHCNAKIRRQLWKRGASESDRDFELRILKEKVHSARLALAASRQHELSTGEKIPTEAGEFLRIVYGKRKG